MNIKAPGLSKLLNYHVEFAALMTRQQLTD